MIRTFLVIFLPCLFFIGCSKPQTPKVNTQNASSVETHSSGNKDHPDKDSKKDGKVISMETIELSDAGSAVNRYRMMYWSEGTKTEAYVAVPKGVGSFPLFISCHGGSAVPSKQKHKTTIGGSYTLNKTIIRNVQPYVITLMPMYRGYGHSNGTVNGLYGDTVDVQNAIKAVMAYFNKSNQSPEVQIQKNRISLSGVSIGGGVALKVAALREDVASVVALSPFVGWDILGTWYQKHNPSRLSNAEETFEPFDPDSTDYQKQSIPYKKIEARTLLLQGKKDEVVPWQTVKILYKKMKKNDQNVTFKLVEGGNHALTNKRDIANKIVNNWLTQS